jgi:hypothetical protein
LEFVAKSRLPPEQTPRLLDDFDAMQLERADDPLPDHEFHVAMLLPAS